MKKARFVAWWAVVFVASYVLLSYLEMVPASVSEANFRAWNAAKSFFSKTEPQSTAVMENAKEIVIEPTVKENVLPERVVIEKIGVDSPILNPESRDVGVLDRALLEGVVRYPGSGGLDDDSNMFLFGHSTGFRVVRNPAFKALNRLGELQVGETISIQTGNTEYIYKVTSVSQVDKDEALVELTLGKKMLTISTCNSFGEKSDRFVVQAVFVQALTR